MRSPELDAARARARSVRDPLLRGVIERALVAAARQDLRSTVEILLELDEPASELFGSVPSGGFDAEEPAPEELENPELVLRPIDEPEDLGLALVVDEDLFGVFEGQD